MNLNAFPNPLPEKERIPNSLPIKEHFPTTSPREYFLLKTLLRETLNCKKLKTPSGDGTSPIFPTTGKKENMAGDNMGGHYRNWER